MAATSWWKVASSSVSSGPGGGSRSSTRRVPAGILPPARRTGPGYRVYGLETLALLAFVTQARCLGFRLDEIERIVTLKRSGRTPFKHVLDLVQLKLENIEQALTDLAEVHGQLRGLLRSLRWMPPVESQRFSGV